MFNKIHVLQGSPYGYSTCVSVVLQGCCTIHILQYMITYCRKGICIEYNFCQMLTITLNQILKQIT